MDKNPTIANDQQQASEQLKQYIHAQLAVDVAPNVFAFAQQYLDHFPLEAWQGRKLNDVYACIYGLWTFIQTHDFNKPKVSIFNPNLEEHGWSCEHTIVTVLHENMPFLVDSIRMEMNRRSIPIAVLKSTLLTICRNSEHRCTELFPRHDPNAKALGEQKCSIESLVYLEINEQTSEQTIRDLTHSIKAILQDVNAVVDDYQAMRNQAIALADQLRHWDKSALANDELIDQLDETQALLYWLTRDHFTFLGCATYTVNQTPEPDDQVILKEQPDGRLGIAKRHGDIMEQYLNDSRNPGMMDFYHSFSPMTFSKSPVRSRVHRRVYPDYILIKCYDKTGRIVNIQVFLGLYTLRVYNVNPAEIPFVRRKVEEVTARSGMLPYSYDGKVHRQIIDVFPKEELFQSTVEELLSNTLAVASVHEQNAIRFIMRKGCFGRFINSILYVPRDIFNTNFRQQAQSLVAEAIGAIDHEYATYLSESTHARLYMIFLVDPNHSVDYDVKQLEEKIIAISRSWQDHLRDALIDNWGEGKGGNLYRQYDQAFPASYQENFDARLAVNDISTIGELQSKDDMATNFYQPVGFDISAMRFKVFRLYQRLELSDVVPVLEHLGLRVRGVHPYKIRRNDGATIWLLDFDLTFGLPVTIDVRAAKAYFQEAFVAIWEGKAESDAFNRLVLGARLNWREVSMLRAYASYMKQTQFNFSHAYIANTLANHLEITRNLVAIFKVRFDPRINQDAHQEDTNDHKRAIRLQKKIIESLDKVDNLNEDQIIRRYLDLISNTLRTNFFQTNTDNNPKPYITLKLNPKNIPDMPPPSPDYELFVYSPHMEGVHLRGGKVARGGIRWSNRLEDYRTEILGLLKAQQVKNAVIVPCGAKGGFISKHPPVDGDRKALLDDGINCYRLFIQGLLDVTDNLVDGKITPPPAVVRHDKDDPYLVVAADKGTATFSDEANLIASSRHFWLGDAFASGGSQGYDHKKMGITARGAWISVQRHFRENDINIQEESCTVIGIGDMSGDVFGNGMLLSEHLCLVAAFNHQHIFVDPTPDPSVSFKERQRLFNLPRSTWNNYKKNLISTGGGVFSREAKSITITPQMQQAFGIEEKQLTPMALIHALLKAPVDLIWSAGIGTYVKASDETHAHADDKTNDGLRVDANELGCKVFAEGGNLGMTQAARVEYSLNKGKCNTDFIDNAAGVDCSDHEVNIKILLDDVVAKGGMTQKRRNELLETMTNDVANLVLKNNYRQAQAISIAEYQSFKRLGEYRHFISALEEQGRLDRRLTNTPEEETMLERQAQKKSLTRPELSVLLSYAKTHIKEALIADNLDKNDYMSKAVFDVFPSVMHKPFHDNILNHRLRKEIVATQVANDMVNNMGITFYMRLIESTSATPIMVARAYTTARDIYEMEKYLNDIEALDYQVSAQLQLQLITAIMQRVRQGTRWLLCNRREAINPEQEIATFGSSIKHLITILPDVLRNKPKKKWQARYDDLLAQGVPNVLAIRSIGLPSVYSGLGIIEAVNQTGRSIELVATVYFILGDKLDLLWLANQIADIAVKSYWQAIARQSFLDNLGSYMRILAVNVIEHCSEIDKVSEYIDEWMKEHASSLRRWRTMISGLQSALTIDFAMLSVSIRELHDLAKTCEENIRACPETSE